MRQAALGEAKQEEKKDQRRRVHEVGLLIPSTFDFYLIMKLRLQDQQVPSLVDWLKIDGEEGEDTSREGIGGALAIPRGSVTMDISMRDPNHTRSHLSPRHTPP